MQLFAERNVVEAQLITITQQSSYQHEDFTECCYFDHGTYSRNTALNLSFSLSLSLSVLTAISPGRPNLAGTGMFSFWILLELRMTEVVLKTGAIRRAKLQSNRRHQQTNTQIFTCQMSFVSPNEQCQGTERKLQ